ncbi:MAG: DUF4827 domain-containing protein [Alloprevotella sp.]|nr:DUF4827 domain-containing protein [Alloprevotella sp.]MBR1652130.1 DUF4827 domain-containing protein [Alloprevotella sp.]
MRQPFSKILLLCLALGACLQSCEEEDSYAKSREREKKQIMSFLKTGVQEKDAEGEEYLLNVPGPYKVISEKEFYANDSTTDVTKNEFVLFAGSGVYMQIVDKGTGEKLHSGETASVICRYTCFNIATDSIEVTNAIPLYVTTPDVMTVTNYLGTFNASFLSGTMMAWARSQSVPNAWTMPLTFIRLGRWDSPTEDIAKVRLIVPSTEGHTYALNGIYPCFYEITYQRGR